jgi:hypothetical protein
MSCKFECDGFPESELVWIPYRINDTLSYSNGDDTITFIVDDYDRAEPDKFCALAEEVICYNIAFTTLPNQAMAMFYENCVITN